ncbi:hypothetical protein LINGRAHAP2_LOCUS13838, partial [Linum grandiflorum]
QEHRIEGYTEPGGADAVRELLLPGAIYRIQNPFLIPARMILRSCPGDFSLQIRPANLLDIIHKNPARPFFPLQSFNIVTMPRLRVVDQLRTTASGTTYIPILLTKPFNFPTKDSLNTVWIPFCIPDIIGRLSGVTRPTTSPAGGLSFKLLINHPRLTFLPIAHYSMVVTSSYIAV